MKLFLTRSKFFRRFMQLDEDPIEASKSMINSIQGLVGISDVFGDRQRSYTIRSVLCIIIFFGCFEYVGTGSQCVYLLSVFPDKLETFKAIDCISATTIPLSIYIFMWTSRNQLKRIFETCREGLSSIPEDSVALASLVRALREGQYLAWFVLVTQFMIHFVYIVAPLIMTFTGYGRHLPTTPSEPYGLTPQYETPYFETIFVLKTVATGFSAINQTGYIILFVCLVSNGLGHFYAINETLNNLNRTLSDDKNTSAEDRDKLAHETLVFCIKRHQFIRIYHTMLEDLYKVIFGVHFLILIVVLVTTLQTFSSWDLRNTLLTGMTGILPLFVYCFGGEMLISAGREMSIALYSCGWQMMKPQEARLVLLMLCITQRPLHLMAADIFIMNRETFGNVAQVVYKIYTVFK